MRLKIGDDFLDSDSSVIAQTYAVNQIGELETRQGGFSNDFTIPLTDKNKGILEFPDDINSSSRNPYSKVDATLYDKGAPIADGFLRFQIVDQNTLQASFFADNTNWYNLIKDKKLTDLNLTAFDHTWDFTTIAAAINADKDSGYTYPLIDYGEFSANNTLQIFSDQMFPAMFVLTLVESLLFDIGWKVDGEVTEHPLYKRMIVPFSGPAFVHNQTWVTDNTTTDTATVPFVFDDDPPLLLIWVTAASTEITIATDPGEYTVTVTLLFSSVANAVKLILFKNSVEVGSIGFFGIGSVVNFTFIVSELALEPGDVLEVQIQAGLSSPVVTLENATIEIEPTLEIARGSEIQMSSIMPDMKQSDFMRYIAFAFGAIFQANQLSKTLTISFFKSITDNVSNALDWSNKIDISATKEVDFTQLLSNYAIQAIMTYAEDDNDAELIQYQDETGQRFGQGQFDIDNEHLEGIKTIYESPFSSMININSFSNTMYIPQIRFIENGERELTPAPKVAILSKNILVSKLSLDLYGHLRIIDDPDGYSGTFEDLLSIPFCWFAKTAYIEEIDSILDSLPFDQIQFPNMVGEPLKDRFLKPYEDILNEIKYLRAFVHLTEVDINALDFTVPVKIEFYKAYFYISKIVNFQGREKVTEVELVKIG